MNNDKMQQTYSFPAHNLDLSKVFGVENLKVLKSCKIIIGEDIIGDNGQTYKKFGNAPNDR